jgi:surface antigen
LVRAKVTLSINVGGSLMTLRQGIVYTLAALGLMTVVTVPAQAIECVPYARAVSGISIRGDAWTWWKNAGAEYTRSAAPRSGAVLVFQRSGKMRHGHVAVVRQVVTPRELVIDHANWGSRRGQKGKVEKNVRVIDVSARNDWSQVRVWYSPVADFGTKVYPTYGFIHPKDGGKARGANPPMRLAGIARQHAPVASSKAISPAAREGRLDLAGYEAIDLEDLSAGDPVPVPRAKPVQRKRPEVRVLR